MGQGKTGGSAGGQGGSAGSSDPFMSFLFGSNWNGGGTSQVGTNPTTTGMSSSPTGLSTTHPTTGMTSSPTGLPTTQPTPTTNPFASPSLTSLMGTVLGGTALNNVNKAMGVQQPTTGMTPQQPTMGFGQPVQQPVAHPTTPTSGSSFAPGSMASKLFGGSGASIPGSKYMKMPDGSFQDPNNPNNTYYGSQPPDQQMGPTNSELGYTPPDQQMGPTNSELGYTPSEGPVAPTDNSQPTDNSSYDYSQPDYSSYDYSQPADTSGLDFSNFDFGGGDW